MNVVEILEKKRDGGECSAAELQELVTGLVEGRIPRYQLSAWLMAVVLRGMTPPETSALTRIMMESGDVLDLGEIPGVKVDKHSTGGVGDKVSIPLAPAVAAAGAVVPMVSGRGLGHTGGTLDKLESVPGLRTDLDASAFRDVVRRVGFSIVGAGPTLAPADRELYALRDVTGTVPSVPLITASILSKKYAAGVEALVLDVKTGSGAFLRDRDGADALARSLCEVSAELGKRAIALITSMEQPLGRAVGNALEMEESIRVLRGEGPEDVKELVLALGAEMLVLANVSETTEAASAMLEETIDSGRGLERLERFLEAQGGDPRVCAQPELLPRAAVVRDVESAEAGYVAAFDCREIGLAANALGAGRERVGDAVRPEVGFLLRARRGDRVERGQPLAQVHAAGEEDAEQAAARFRAAVRMAPEAPASEPLVLARTAPG